MFRFNKKNEITSVNDYQPTIKAIDIPRPSAVGEMVSMFEGKRNELESEIDTLTRSITEDIERHRQLIASLAAVTAAQTMLADDKSLSKEQRQMADRQVLISLKDIKFDE